MIVKFGGLMAGVHCRRLISLVTNGHNVLCVIHCLTWPNGLLWLCCYKIIPWIYWSTICTVLQAHLTALINHSISDLSAVIHVKSHMIKTNHTIHHFKMLSSIFSGSEKATDCIINPSIHWLTTGDGWRGDRLIQFLALNGKYKVLLCFKRQRGGDEYVVYRISQSVW